MKPVSNNSDALWYHLGVSALTILSSATSHSFPSYGSQCHLIDSLLAFNLRPTLDMYHWAAGSCLNQQGESVKEADVIDFPPPAGCASLGVQPQTHQYSFQVNAPTYECVCSQAPTPGFPVCLSPQRRYGDLSPLRRPDVVEESPVAIIASHTHTHTSFPQLVATSLGGPDQQAHLSSTAISTPAEIQI